MPSVSALSTSRWAANVAPREGTGKLSSSWWNDKQPPAYSQFANANFDLGNVIMRETQFVAFTTHLSLTYLEYDPSRADRVLLVEYRNTVFGVIQSHIFKAFWSPEGLFKIERQLPAHVPSSSGDDSSATAPSSS